MASIHVLGQRAQTKGYMPQVLSLLQRHPFAKGLAPAQLERLACITESINFDEDVVVLRPGEPARGLYLLLSGTASIEIRRHVYSMCIQRISAGGIFGWSSVLGEHETLFQVRSLEPCAALRVDGAGLAVVCDSDPIMASLICRRVADIVVSRLCATEQQLAKFCSSPAVEPQ